MARVPGLKEVIRRAERYAQSPPPELPDELYLDYSRTGNRDRYQRKLSDRRNRLATLAMAECLENAGRFLPAIHRALEANLAREKLALAGARRESRQFPRRDHRDRPGLLGQRRDPGDHRLLAGREAPGGDAQPGSAAN